MQIVIFELAEEQYGLEISAVDSIIAAPDIVSVPHAPSFVEGIAQLRGEVLPIIDLRKRFGLPQQAYSKHTRFVVVGMENMKVGMAVDTVTEVLTLPDDCIEPPSPLVTSSASEFVTGVVNTDRHLILLVDLQKVLTVTEKEDLENTVSKAG